MTSANQLRESLGVLRRQWQQRVFLESAVWIVLAAVVAVIAGLALHRAFGTSETTVVLARVMGYALIVAAIVRFLIIPLRKRASDERFALYVEERRPELRQALLSAMHELQVPESKQASPSLTARLIERTVVLVKPLQEGAKLERPRMVKAARSLGIIAVATALLFVVGPRGLGDMAKLLFVPWSTAEAATTLKQFVSIEPGNAAIPRGAAVDIRAALNGFDADAAELVFRADSGSDWVRIPMSRDSAATRFTSRMFDLTRPTEYYVESNGIVSPTYKLTITNLPAVNKMQMDLKFPAYTGMPAEHLDPAGDVAAVVGTTVTINATTTLPVKSGTLHFDNDSLVPFTVGVDGRISASFRVKHTGFYRIDLVSAQGTAVPGAVQYAIEALPDRAPTVTIDDPGRDTKATNVDEVTIGVKADDDYGVQSMQLHYRVNGGDEKIVSLTDSTNRRSKEPHAAYTLFLEQLKLTPGDLVAYNAVAKDGAGNVGTSDMYFIEIRPFNKNYRQGESGGGGGGGGGGGQQDSPDGLVARQKDVVSGTFNWLRDSSSAKTGKRKDDVTTINIAQGRLREDVVGLSRRITERMASSGDTLFPLIARELDSAAIAMKASEEKLVKSQVRDALPPEQKALQHLQRSEALYRDVEVKMGQQGGGGGGGGGGGQKAEDLADLFSLETDKLKNQYEAVQQQQSQQDQAQKEVDATMERLKQLAQRQQQENERMQKMADALRDKLGQDASASGGSGAQREMARQAEEEARRLERLSREQNNKDLADAANKMQQAADAMKRASNGSAAQGAAALEQLQKASNQLANAQSATQSDAIRKLAQQAQDLKQREQAIKDGVQQMGEASGADRQNKTAQLGAQKDALSRDVAKLEQDADRVSRDNRRDQPSAAGKINSAAEAIRDARLKEMIDFSKNVIRSGSPEYANSFETKIGENIGDVADKLKDAANSVGKESASRQQERALDKARDLVQGMQSLKDRIDDKTGQGGQQNPNGQQGQNGQQQGQSQNGQQGQQGQGQGQAGQQGKNGQQQGQGQASQQGQGQGQGQSQAQGQGRGQGQGQQGQGQGQAQGQGQGGQGQNPGQGGQGGGQPNGNQRGGIAGGTATGISKGDMQQLSREFGLRRQNAEDLRKDLAKQGLDTKGLDQAIGEMRRLEDERTLGNIQGLEALQSSVLEGLKTFEFGLYRQLGLGNDKGAAIGARAPVPAEYRAQVEEYYRSLAASKKKPH
jgi:hypothetical protein